MIWFPLKGAAQAGIVDTMAASHHDCSAEHTERPLGKAKRVFDMRPKE